MNAELAEFDDVIDEHGGSLVLQGVAVGARIRSQQLVDELAARRRGADMHAEGLAESGAG